MAAAPLALPQPDWLQTTLSVTGPAAERAAFREIAAGAGVGPWAVDYDRLEEDWFYLLMAPPPPHRAISVQGARILARRLREAAWARHEEALGRVGASRACPFDLHRLLPVPADILHLGEDHPKALAWLWEHWGTTWPLRRVERLPDETAFRVRFWSADWTPWPALAGLSARWPRLCLEIRPAY
ncbi:MAG: hypothetical protein P4L83_21755 [Nevskia sp.]|nr:hypothetical protein [Nevskia sp.]